MPFNPGIDIMPFSGVLGFDRLLLHMYERPRRKTFSFLTSTPSQVVGEGALELMNTELFFKRLQRYIDVWMY